MMLDALEVFIPRDVSLQHASGIIWYMYVEVCCVHKRKCLSCYL